VRIPIPSHKLLQSSQIKRIYDSMIYIMSGLSSSMPLRFDNTTLGWEATCCFISVYDNANINREFQICSNNVSRICLDRVLVHEMCYYYRIRVGIPLIVAAASCTISIFLKRYMKGQEYNLN
jgi:hypothetical protein